MGLAPNIVVNWKADGNNSLTLSIGFGIGKLFTFGKLPGTFILKGDYSVVEPEDVGQRRSTVEILALAPLKPGNINLALPGGLQ